MNAPTTLPVMFCVERSGEWKGTVTAVFPTIPWDYAGREITCWQWEGGHGGCTVPWLQDRTRPARPDEYAGMLETLRGIYGSSIGPADPPIALKVVHRRTSAMLAEFERAVQRNLRQLRANPAGGPWSPDARENAAAAMAERGI